MKFLTAPWRVGCNRTKIIKAWLILSVSTAPWRVGCNGIDKDIHDNYNQSFNRPVACGLQRDEYDKAVKELQFQPPRGVWVATGRI